MEAITVRFSHLAKLLTLFPVIHTSVNMDAEIIEGEVTEISDQMQETEWTHFTDGFISMGDSR